jgi:hypothetical protein
MLSLSRVKIIVLGPAISGPWAGTNRFMDIQLNNHFLVKEIHILAHNICIC